MSWRRIFVVLGLLAAGCANGSSGASRPHGARDASGNARPDAEAAERDGGAPLTDARSADDGPETTPSDGGGADASHHDDAGPGDASLPGDQGAAADLAAVDLGPDPAPPPIFAIGDLHGDTEATRGALRMAGVLDEQDHWSGGRAVVVQVGDTLNRGSEDREVFDLLERLQDEAAAAGGALHLVLGNHEVMNSELYFAYTAEDAWAAFADIPHDPNDPTLAAFPAEQRGRVAAFRPGGPYARMLAERPVVLILGETLFVHGSLTPAWAALGVEALNETASQWLLGTADEPESLSSAEGPVWDRTFGYDLDADGCALLQETLDMLAVERMVVAHTPQISGITSGCGGRVWRIDTGMCACYGGPTEVLRIGPERVEAVWQPQ